MVFTLKDLRHKTVSLGLIIFVLTSIFFPYLSYVNVIGSTSKDKSGLLYQTTRHQIIGGV
ncbi:hypothetical protein [Sulfolobus acidocaldarius]|uniref:hypothetical protein n=1 Tax=Sulfolobus acidocaldarius TaxID=2285 RepID=UPI000A50FF43|nr:hypothetical protein [Sulfolobus acidocaldarius]